MDMPEGQLDDPWAKHGDFCADCGEAIIDKEGNRLCSECVDDACPICGQPSIRQKEDDLPRDVDYSVIFCGNHSSEQEWDWIEEVKK